MSPFTHITKENPGRDVTRAGGRYFRLEQCDVFINSNFAMAAQG
jgi:hypothetical protein